MNARLHESNRKFVNAAFEVTYKGGHINNVTFAETIIMTLQACTSEMFAFLHERKCSLSSQEELIRWHDVAVLCNEIQTIRGMEPVAIASTRSQLTRV